MFVYLLYTINIYVLLFYNRFFTGLVKQHTNDNGIFNQGKLFLKYNGIFVDSGRVHMIPLQITSSKN